VVSENRRRFRVDWVLVRELAIGPAPRESHHLDRLENEGIKCVLSLCSEQEAPPPNGQYERFNCKRLVLPDHNAQRLPKLCEIEQSLELLADLRKQGSVFIHCVAAMERSPLVCLAWLVRHQGLSPQQSLDYLMQVHPGTSPLPGQLAILTDL
jgi:hypothetical protein